MAQYSHYRDLRAFTSGEEFAEWERQALNPKDVLRWPHQLHSRARVADVMRDLRAGRTPALDTWTVLQELRELVVEQTKAQNAYTVYSPEEIALLRTTVDGLEDWSRLVKLLAQVRAKTSHRYDLLMQEQHQQQGYSDGWAHTSQELAA